MKSLVYYSILIVNLILSQLLLIYTAHTTEVDFIHTRENKEDLPRTETDDEPNFLFDDSTFYKIVWANYIPAVIASTSSSSSASSSKDKLKYKEKDINDKDTETEVKLYDKSDKERKNDLFEEVLMTSPNKEQYRCLIPILNKPKEKTTEEEAKGISKNPYTVLKALFRKRYCSYRVETFWTYEICHGYHIRQYHDDARNKDHTQEYYLGRFNQAEMEKYEKDYELNERSKKLPTVNVFDFTMPYISVNMTGGTLCDLSQKKRVAKVIYVCVEDSLHDLYSIKETSTCEYEVITFSSLLCEVPEFRMKISQENDIKCYPLNGSPPFPTGFDILNKTSQ